MVDEEEASGAGEEESAAEVAPAESSDDGREDEAHAEDEREIVAVLPLDDRVVVEVGNVGDTGTTARLDDHPAKVSPPEALLRRIRVEVCVGVAMVCAVSPRPPFHAPLDCAASSKCQEVLERQRGGVGPVGPPAGEKKRFLSVRSPFFEAHGLLVKRSGTYSLW